jgi:ligand-binding sensor protein
MGQKKAVNTLHQFQDTESMDLEESGLSERLFDLQDREQWMGILRAIGSELGMVATLVDTEGRILLHTGEYPDICRRIRGDDQSISFVCGQTVQVMLKQAEKTQQPVVDLCQIGLSKMLIPVFQRGSFLGAVTACARVPAGEAPDPFMLAQEIGVGEDEAEALLRAAPQVDEEHVEKVTQKWADRIRSLEQKANTEKKGS